MSIYIQKSKDKIYFTIWGKLCQSIFDWETSLDEMVFNEQLNTGSFHGKFSVRDEDILQVMRQLKKEGKILPYYGVGGSRGSCAYHVQINESLCKIKVENTTVQDEIEFQYRLSDVQESPFTRLKTWLALNLQLGKVPEPFFILKIDGNELENLKNWKFWDDSKALTSKYIYEFGQVSLGRLGYAIKVKDSQNSEVIDISDYANW